MRTLNEYSIDLTNGGTLVLSTSTPETDPSVVFDAGQFISVAFNATVAIDIACTADVLVNTADPVTGAVTVDFPATALRASGVATLSGPVHLVAGDILALEGDASAGTGSVHCSAIIRR